MFFDAKGTQEYKLTICDSKTQTDRYLFTDTVLTEN